MFNVPENLVRRELAKLAEEKLILLAGWDGRQIRDYTNWPSGEEFINSRLGAGHVHVALPDAGESEEGLRAFALLPEADLESKGGLLSRLEVFAPKCRARQPERILRA